MKKPLAILSFLASLLPLPVHANVGSVVDELLLLSMDDLMSLKVKISTHTEQTLAKAPSVVSVVTAEDIKATGATNLTEILQSVPGIYVRTNLFGFRPLVTFRGASTSNHTLLMVNGAPMRDLVWSAGIFWKGLPASMIERIEIIRGPGSALFGADASAGVINVITKTAGRINQSEAGLRAGSFDSQAGWIQHGGQWNGFDVGFTAQLSRTDGHRPFIARDGQTATDLLFNPDVSYAPGHATYGWDGQDIRFSLARENWRLLADYIGHTNLETGLTGAAVLDPLTRASASRLDLALIYSNEAFAPHWALNAELRAHHLQYSSGTGFQERPPGYTDTTGTYPTGVLNVMKSAEHGMSFEASGLYTGFRDHTIRLGLGHKVDEVYRVEQLVNQGSWLDGHTINSPLALVDISDTPYAFAPEKSRSNSFLYLQDIWTLDPEWELTAGLRYDHFSDFGSVLNPRLALVWQASKQFTTKLMYGQAFRAPSYYELYAQTAANTPNPLLTPERTRTWDVSFAFQPSPDLKLGLDLFHFEQNNLIVPDTTPAKQFQNSGDLTTQGVELEAQWQAGKTLRLTGNLTHMAGESSPLRSPSLPMDKAYLRADWTFHPNWNWNVQATHVGKRDLPAGDPRAPLGAYTLVDTTIRHFHRGNWEFAASVRNLLDADAREYSNKNIPDNLPLPGRSFYAEATYKF